MSEPYFQRAFKEELLAFREVKFLISLLQLQLQLVILGFVLIELDSHYRNG